MERSVAVGLMTQPGLDRLGHTFQRLWPVDTAPRFSGLLEAIDEADRGSMQAPAAFERDSGYAGRR